MKDVKYVAEFMQGQIIVTIGNRGLEVSIGELDVEVMVTVGSLHDPMRGAVVVVKVLLVREPGPLETQVTLHKLSKGLCLDYSAAPGGDHDTILCAVAGGKLQLLLQNCFGLLKLVLLLHLVLSSNLRMGLSGQQQLLLLLSQLDPWGHRRGRGL